MSQQLVCDECNKPIDTTKPYYTLTGTKVQMIEDVLTVVDTAITLDYHAEHVPGYKVMGEEVIVPPETEPVEPTPEPEPEPVALPEWEPAKGPDGTVDPAAPGVNS